ncbi:uncharacterized protein B0I36DRAFT_326854 [Microdochium trichocladiopsis]|uniref:Uncharacterized protein n=1 Tax=Microdochium trichocladiopsis TaxID=1682393 RepID=A0A9P9BN35_9PEZI|nr:uncharacterized protein B0I36DRAFT_326854 [Microdochium trichocladiopsis]KAH7027308.1 hypothetical protein B0I36DRAFT_326854 [Microdochium trichocladiopsis]
MQQLMRGLVANVAVAAVVVGMGGGCYRLELRRREEPQCYLRRTRRNQPTTLTSFCILQTCSEYCQRDNPAAEPPRDSGIWKRPGSSGI